MNELTRDEMNARLETIEARMDARFAEADARNEARFAKAEAKNEARFTALGNRFTQLETNLEKRISDLIRWMIVTAIAAAGFGVAGLALVLNHGTRSAATSPTTPPAPVVINVVPPAPAAAPQ